MILIDTSVLVDYIRTKDALLLRKMQHHGGAVCGVVRAELLAGSKNPRDRARLTLLLDSFQAIDTPETLCVTIGDHAALLRARGVNIPLPDAIIATIATTANVELWSRDAHFILAQPFLPSDCS
jgi:predicted nucleic acid-binding protein